MRNNLQKHKILTSIVIFCVIIFLGICTRIILDRSDIARLKSSIVQLHQQLEADDLVNFKHYEECRRPKDDLGIQTSYFCSVGLRAKYSVKDTDQADVYLSRFRNAIAKDHMYNTSDPISPVVIDRITGLNFGVASYTHISTGRRCGASYHYDDGGTKNWRNQLDHQPNISFDFDCDDLSWFAKTFDFGG